MAITVRISNDSLNCYGTRILTAGLDIEQYRRNPVLLYMHERGHVIGYVKNIKKTDSELTGDLEFDEASDESMRCKKQFEFGSLRMVSAGVQPLETSKDPSLMLPGQDLPTVTKGKLIEVSVADMGGNDDAIRLIGGAGQLVKLVRETGYETSKPSLDKDNMDMKQLALSLGLAETATEAEISAKINELRESQNRLQLAMKEVDDLRLSQITSLVEAAISEKKISLDRKDQFIKLGQTVGIDGLRETLDAMSPAVKLSKVLQGAPDGGPSEYKKLSDVPSEKVEELRSADREQYVKLFKAEYGFEPTLDLD